MAEMNDKRFRELFHAYELGILLTEDERREIEIYLLEHDELLEEAREFQAVIKQMRQNPEVRQTIGELAERQAVAEKVGFWRTMLKEKLVTRMVPAATLLVIILLLVLKPWHIEVQISREAVASANSIAIMYFQNLADIKDTDRLGAITTNLLITDFSESEYIRVLSSQRLNDIMKLLGVEKTSRIDIDMATKIAQKANSRLMLSGNILQVEPDIIITAQLVDIDSGIIRTSTKVTSMPGEDIFALVDRLSAEIRDKLFWPSSVKSEPDPRVADITTRSKEAYRYYLDGLDYKYKWYSDEAEQCFRQAVNLDSTFAMCYYYLSTYGTRSEQLKMIKTAAQYLGQVTRKESYYINSRLHWLLSDTLEAINQLASITKNYPQEKEAYYQLSIYKYAQGLFSESNENAGKAIQIDPFYKVAYNQLAYGYLKLNDYDSALNAIDKYIALAPEEANPYDSKAEIYLQMRKPLEAVEAYEKAVELKPDFYNSLRQLGRLYLSLGKYDKAVTNLQKLVTSSNVNFRISGVLGKAYVLIFQGKFGEALESLDSSIMAIRYDSNPVHAGLIEAYAHFMKSKIYEERGQFGPALDEINQYIRVYKKVFPKEKILHEYFRVYIMAASGDMETAKGIVRELKYNADNVNSNYYDYYMALGSVAFFEKDFTSAIKAFKQASKEYTTFQSYYLMGRTYLEMKQPEKAIEVFQNLDFIYATWGTYNCLWDAKMRYYWGCACDDAKKYDEAKSFLKNFIWYWQNADFEPEEVTDAKYRLARLKEL